MRRSPPQHLSELRLSCPDSAHLGTYCSRRKPSPANGEAPGLSRRSSFERGNDLPELASSTATTDQHPSNICPCDRGHRLKTSCLLGPAGRLPITSGGRSIDGSGESNPARVGWRRRADRRRCSRSLLLGTVPLRPADLAWGTHNKSLERTRPARAFGSIIVLPGRSAQPLGASINNQDGDQTRTQILVE